MKWCSVDESIAVSFPSVLAREIVGESPTISPYELDENREATEGLLSELMLGKLARKVPPEGGPEKIIL